MINFFISRLSKIAHKRYPQWYRVVSLMGALGLVFLLFPLFYIYSGRYIESLIQLSIPSGIAYIIAIPALLCGATVIIWTFILQYVHGKGSGSHMVPTQKLITSGPYSISRHPMLLGATLFYFGTGTLLSSLTIGLYGAITTAILAYFFARYIEEPVLIEQFGEEYKKYQKEVPIIPLSLTCFNNCYRKHKSNN